MLTQELITKSQLPNSSENDFSFCQEHFYGQRNDLKISDQQKQQLLQLLDVTHLIKSLSTVPLVSQGRAAKHVVLCGGVAKMEGCREVLLKKLQEMRTPFTFEFAEAEGFEVAVEQLKPEHFWEQLK